MKSSRRLLGLDAGLRHTGWGLIDVTGNHLVPVANGVVHSEATQPISERLVTLHRGIVEIIAQYRPDETAIEETFVNKNPESTLKLGLARGAVLLAPALAGLPVAEYAPNRIKKTVVGVGHADKRQVQMMVSRILPGMTLENADSADALAVAICHAHFGPVQAFAAEHRQSGSGPRSVGTGLQQAIAAALAREAGR